MLLDFENSLLKVSVQTGILPAPDRFSMRPASRHVQSWNRCFRSFLKMSLSPCQRHSLQFLLTHTSDMPSADLAGNTATYDRCWRGLKLLWLFLFVLFLRLLLSCSKGSLQLMLSFCCRCLCPHWACILRPWSLRSWCLKQIWVVFHYCLLPMFPSSSVIPYLFLILSLSCWQAIGQISTGLILSWVSKELINYTQSGPWT